MNSIELLTNLNTETFNRPPLPKQQSSKKFAMIEILNQFILPKFVNNTSFKKLHSIILIQCVRKFRNKLDKIVSINF
jgi:hypothetical protein